MGFWSITKKTIIVLSKDQKIFLRKGQIVNILSFADPYGFVADI